MRGVCPSGSLGRAILLMRESEPAVRLYSALARPLGDVGMYFACRVATGDDRSTSTPARHFRAVAAVAILEQRTSAPSPR